MAPISTTITEVEEQQVLQTTSIVQNGNSKSFSEPSKEKRSIFQPKVGNGQPLKWLNIVLITFFHCYAIYNLFVIQYSFRLLAFVILTGILSGFGVTGGVHRYWTHKTYKANVPLRVILMVCFSLAGQNTIFDWVRDHRVHHKYSDTEADPHNAKRGFFFSHCGWLMQRKHPEVIRKGNQIDMSDVLSDPVVQFSQRHFVMMKLMCCYIVPTLIPTLCWGEPWYNSFMAQITRHIFILNSTWSVNSAAHIWGYKPYDTRIKPSENVLVAAFSLGEGWHNYHHVFPWDYKAAELGNYSLNMTTMFLDFFAKIGWAWDLKHPSKELVRKVMLKHGDTHCHHHHTEVTEEEDLQFRKLQEDLQQPFRKSVSEAVAS